MDVNACLIQHYFLKKLELLLHVPDHGTLITNCCKTCTYKL